MYFNNSSNDICVHKDDAYYKRFSSIKSAIEHFEKLNFDVKKQKQYTSDNGCIVEEYHIDKTKEYEYEM